MELGHAVECRLCRRGADRRAVIEETRRHGALGDDGVPRLMTRPWMPEIRSEPSGNGAALCATFYAANIEISRYYPLMRGLFNCELQKYVQDF